jgi:RHS repeat-associated protein
VHHGPTSAVTLYRYDAAGRRTHEIRGEPGRLCSVRYRWDGLGRLREVHRREGARPDQVTRLRLGPRGELRSVEGPPLDGLEWLHHRTLDLATGSFLSPDPLAGGPGSAVGANPYHYAANDPVGLIDPFGLRPMTDADLERLRESAGRPAWQKAYDSAQDLVDHPIDWAREHWETVAAAGLVVVGGVLVATGVGAPIGAGILVGAGMAFSTQVALTGEVDQRSLLVSTAAGAIGGGVGGATSAMTVGSQVAIGASTDMTLSAGAQYATAGTVDPQQVLFDGVLGATTAGVGAKLPWAKESIPLGFESRAQYKAFGRELRLGLAEAGYGDVEPAIRGSSVTGVRFDDGSVLTPAGPDDFDLALVSESLFNDAKALGLRPRKGGGRTGPIDRSKYLDPLGLSDVHASLNERLGRKVSFMPYRDLGAVAERPGPYKIIPGPGRK